MTDKRWLALRLLVDAVALILFVLLTPHDLWSGLVLGMSGSDFLEALAHIAQDEEAEE